MPGKLKEDNAMSDIMKHILDPEAARNDPYGHLLNEEDWSETHANALADKEGIAMGIEHWAIVYFLRNHAREHGLPDNGRKLLTLLANQFKRQGGRQYLFQLFPKGPVLQACRIAGLPLPSHTVDPSFGSVH